MLVGIWVRRRWIARRKRGFDRLVQRRFPDAPFFGLGMLVIVRSAVYFSGFVLHWHLLTCSTRRPSSPTAYRDNDPRTGVPCRRGPTHRSSPCSARRPPSRALP